MKNIAAYLMLVLGGKAKPSASDVKAVLASVGADADDAKIATLIEQLAGKSVPEVLEAGRARLSSVPSLGGGGGGGAAAPTQAAAEEKKEAAAAPAEEEDESDEEGMLGIFD